MAKIVINKVQEVFGGGRVCVEDKPLFCPHCDRDLLKEYRRLYDTAPVSELIALIKKRTTRIVERKWPDGRREWQCHGCGRLRQILIRYQRKGSENEKRADREVEVMA